MESATLGGTMRGVAREAVNPACREGRIVRVARGRLEVAVRSLMGDSKTLPARGAAPRVSEGSAGVLELREPAQGDAAWIAEDEGGQWVVVAWEPAQGNRPRVVGATTAKRRKGLAKMFHVWSVAAPYYGRAGAQMPRVRFGGDDLIFVGWSTDPPGDLASILATGQVEWPDWVNRGFIGEAVGEDLDQDAGHELLIHEWAHAFQLPGLSIVKSEGGAQAFTRRFAPEIYDALGIVYVNPAMGEDQYTSIDDTTDSGHPDGATGWVEEHMGEQWIVEDQFR